jgi:hypothetical protein
MSLDQDLSQLKWDDAGDEWQAKPAAAQIDLPPQQTSFEKLKGTCGRAFACTCGTGGGFLVSHIGCVVSPTLAFMGVAGGASMSVVSLAASAVLTAGGLGFWYVMRGMTASKMEKTLTVAGALTGAVMAASLHLGGVIGGHNHNLDEALDWYRSLDETRQTEIQETAERFGMPLNDYVLQICGPLVSPVESSAPAPGL